MTGETFRQTGFLKKSRKIVIFIIHKMDFNRYKKSLSVATTFLRDCSSTIAEKEAIAG